jgi:hypothetical protein
MARERTGRRGSSVYWLPDTIEALEALAEKNRTSMSAEAERIIRAHLEIELSKPAPEKLPLPIIDTTMPVHKSDFLNRFSCATELERLFEYLEDDKANLSDETIDQAIFLIQFEVQRRQLDGRSWQTFDAVATERLRKCSGLRVPVLKTMLSAMMGRFNFIAFASTETMPQEMSSEQPRLEVPSQVDDLPYTLLRLNFETVDDVISKINTDITEHTGVIITTRIFDRGDMFYFFVVFDGKEKPVAMQIRFAYQETVTEPHESFQNKFKKVRSEIFDAIPTLDNEPLHKHFENHEELNAALDSEFPQIPEYVVR